MGTEEKNLLLERRIEWLRKELADHIFYTTKFNRAEAEDIVKRLFDRMEANVQ